VVSKADTITPFSPRVLQLSVPGLLPPDAYAATAASAPTKDIASSKVKVDFSPVKIYLGYLSASKASTVDSSQPHLLKPESGFLCVKILKNLCGS
jgi:hypothetical protein